MCKSDVAGDTFEMTGKPQSPRHQPPGETRGGPTLAPWEVKVRRDISGARALEITGDPQRNS